MSKEKQASFPTGAKVTYGSHGIGTVEEYICEIVLNQELYLYKLRFGNGNIIKVTESVANRDFKLLVVKPQLDAVIAILRQPPVKRQRAWHHKERSYALVLGTQDATALAKLVRDLYPHDSSPNFTWLTLYRNGLYQLVQLLTVTEGIDATTVLTRLNEATELVFRSEDALPISYTANARSAQPRPSVSGSEYEAVVPVRQTATSQRTDELKQSVVPKPKSPPLPKAREETSLAAKAATLNPARTKVVSQAAAPVAKAKPQPRARKSSLPTMNTSVAEATSGLRHENLSLRETIKQLREENKKLLSAAAGASSLATQLESARKTITALRLQLTEMEQQKNSITRERQRIDREQSGREALQTAHSKALGDAVGVFFSTSCLLAAALQDKMATSSLVQPSTERISSDAADPAQQQYKELLRNVRRSNSMRKRRIEALEAEQKTLRRELKELKRFEVLVVAHEATIATQNENLATAEKIRAEIEQVRVDLFQYIFERTDAVERLRAYIKELTADSKI